MLFSKRSKGGAHTAPKGGRKKSPPKYTEAPMEAPAPKPQKESPDSRQKQTLRRSLPFYAALAALTVFAWILPLRPSYSLLEKRELEKFPEFSTEALITGDWFDGINLWFSDTFPGREGWVNMQNRFSELYGDRSIVYSGSIVETQDVFVPSEPVTTPPPVMTPPPPVSSDPAATPDPGQPTVPEQPVTPDAAPPAPVPTHDPSSGVDMDIDATTRLGSVVYFKDTGYELYSLGEANANLYGKLLGKAATTMKDDCRLFSILAPNAGGIMLSYDIYDQLYSIRQDKAIESYYAQAGEDLIPVKIYDNLRAHNNEYLYFRTDHHWTHLAAYYAYEEWCKAAGVEPVPLSEYDTVEYPGFLGSYYQRTGSQLMANNPDSVVAYVPRGELSCKYQNGAGWVDSDVIVDKSGSEANQKYLTFLGGDHYQTVITNDAIQDDSACLVIQDSYGSPFDVFLTQHYHTVVVMDFRNGINVWQVAEEYGIDDIIVLTEIILAQGNDALGLFQYDFRYWTPMKKEEDNS